MEGSGGLADHFCLATQAQGGSRQSHGGAARGCGNGVGPAGGPAGPAGGTSKAGAAPISERGGACRAAGGGTAHSASLGEEQGQGEKRLCLIMLQKCREKNFFGAG